MITEVGRGQDRDQQDALLPVRGCHPFLTDNDGPVTERRPRLPRSAGG